MLNQSFQLNPLLALAHEYGVVPLTEACGEVLGKSLEPENVFELLEIANKFKSDSLRVFVSGKVITASQGCVWQVPCRKLWNYDGTRSTDEHRCSNMGCNVEGKSYYSMAHSSRTTKYESSQKLKC
jgi:hypothetical protein